MTSLKSYSTEVKKKIKCISLYKEFQEWLDPESYVDRAYFLSVPFLSVFFFLLPFLYWFLCFSAVNAFLYVARKSILGSSILYHIQSLLS